MSAAAISMSVEIKDAAFTEYAAMSSAAEIAALSIVTIS